MMECNVKNAKPAKRYSNALFKSAIEVDLLDKIYNDIVFVNETININANLKEFIENPIISVNDKKEVIDKLFSPHIDKITIDFLFVLADVSRLDILSDVLYQLSIKYNEEKNIIKPKIISAVELTENQKRKLIEKIEAKLSKKIMPEYITDSDIIGGLILKIKDKTVDCSLKTKFYNMKQQLTKGNRYGSD